LFRTYVWDPPERRLELIGEINVGRLEDLGRGHNRPTELTVEYRTTEEIRRAAVAMLGGCEADDLDEGSDEVRRHKSISHGAHPQFVDVAHMEDALKAILPPIKPGLAPG
jgi:hypothetical protein